jgi:hypothetical protein
MASLRNIATVKGRRDGGLSEDDQVFTAGCPLCGGTSNRHFTPTEFPSTAAAGLAEAMPTWALAASLACLKHSARAAWVLFIFCPVCADSEVARNGSKAIANSVRVLSIFASL